MSEDVKIGICQSTLPLRSKSRSMSAYLDIHGRVNKGQLSPQMCLLPDRQETVTQIRDLEWDHRPAAPTRHSIGTRQAMKATWGLPLRVVEGPVRWDPATGFMEPSLAIRGPHSGGFWSSSGAWWARGMGRISPHLLFTVAVSDARRI